MEKEATTAKIDFEAEQNLLGFFDLLLKIDKRNNPENYEYDDNRNTDTTNQAK